MIDPTKDRELMELAVKIAAQSRSESDGRVHPLVGAVIATQSGHVLASACRGQRTPGNHAEQEALLDVRDDQVAGAVVYSTLEPCVYRGKQTPCAHRLLDKQVSEVVIGILDPNREIRGRGWWKFEERGIKVRNFHPELVQAIRRMNQAFIDDQLGPGIVITQVQPWGLAAINVTADHRTSRTRLIVGDRRTVVRGEFRYRPDRGHRIHLFVRIGRYYFPQAAISFGHDADLRDWQCPSAWLSGNPADQDQEIIVAEVSEDLGAAVGHYGDVREVLYPRVQDDAYVGIRMDPEPPGFKRLTHVPVAVGF